jgi:diadenosine tetraphosphate (Ap4A) HIT family hydrolase
MFNLTNFKEAQSEIIPFSNRIIFSSNDFFCVPSLGQIVEGYCLIFPYREVLNLSILDSYEKQDLLKVVHKLNEILTEKYGPTIIFEQGAIEEKSKVGCGVDIAHLHIVPNFEVENVINRLDSKYQKISFHNSLMEWLTTLSPAQRPYMMIGSLNGPIITYDYGEKRESQVIRKILASIAPGHPKWDWRASGTEKRLWRTFDTLRTSLSHIT